MGLGTATANGVAWTTYSNRSQMRCSHERALKDTSSRHRVESGDRDSQV